MRIVAVAMRCFCLHRRRIVSHHFRLRGTPQPICFLVVVTPPVPSIVLFVSWLGHVRESPPPMFGFLVGTPPVLVAAIHPSSP